MPTILDGGSVGISPTASEPPAVTKPLELTVTFVNEPAVTPDAFKVRGSATVPLQSSEPVPVASPVALMVCALATKLRTFVVVL
ncbi:hypothetical protein D3C71_1732200 [compost metagenome]